MATKNQLYTLDEALPDANNVIKDIRNAHLEAFEGAIITNPDDIRKGETILNDGALTLASLVDNIIKSCDKLETCLEYIFNENSSLDNESDVKISDSKIRDVIEEQAAKLFKNLQKLKEEIDARKEINNSFVTDDEQKNLDEVYAPLTNCLVNIFPNLKSAKDKESSLDDSMEEIRKNDDEIDLNMNINFVANKKNDLDLNANINQDNLYIPDDKEDSANKSYPEIDSSMNDSDLSDSPLDNNNKYPDKEADTARKTASVSVMNINKKTHLSFLGEGDTPIKNLSDVRKLLVAIKSSKWNSSEYNDLISSVSKFDKSTKGILGSIENPTDQQLKDYFKLKNQIKKYQKVAKGKLSSFSNADYRQVKIYAVNSFEKYLENKYPVLEEKYQKELAEQAKLKANEAPSISK